MSYSRSALTGNSRPISLLPLPFVFSKLVEKIVNVQIQDYFTRSHLFTSNQQAYKERHSTSTALAQMTRSMENKRSVGAVVLLDFSAAFDMIDHGLLLEKLRGYGYELTALSWMNSDLTCRRQRVILTAVCLIAVVLRGPSGELPRSHDPIFYFSN